MPPVVGVAVKVVEVPGQTVAGTELMLTEAGAEVGVTDTVIPVEVAVVGLAQAELETRFTVITSPSAKLEAV